MSISNFIILFLATTASVGIVSSTPDENGFLERGYRAMHRVYEDCQHRNIAVSPCLKKKAIAFFERLGRIQSLPIAENVELIRVSHPEVDPPKIDIDATLGRTSSSSKDEVLNDILFERISSLMNGFNVQIRLPKTSTSELKRSLEEGRGKMKKMMGMMMMGVAMKMAALVPIALGVLFLLAGKALIISKIALVLSLIIGLKKLLSQKQGHDSHGGWQQGGGGWDRSLKGDVEQVVAKSEVDKEFAQNLAYNAHQRR